jgi:signal transduction histidine kinase
VSARTAVEAALQLGRQEQARRVLRELVTKAPVIDARVYDAAGRVLVSPEGAANGAHPTIWLPHVTAIPEGGLARPDAAKGIVHAFVPLSVPPARLLEVEYSLGPIREAMDRGARLGLMLVVGSVFALAAILFTMLEREVVAPMARVTELLPVDHAPRRAELDRLQEGVAALIQRELAAEDRAAAQQRMIARQAGFAQVGELAAEMAHEYKRPLTSIQSAVHLLSQEYVLEERGQRLLGAVEDQLAHLSETMRDLFTLAKPVGIETQVVSLRDVFDRCIAQIAGHPAALGLELTRDYGDEDVLVDGDPKRLEQAVLNLMLNAAESMGPGGTLSLRIGRTADRAVFEIGDTGAGIPEAELEKVLLPFYSTKPAGTGLGLPLVARVIAAHDGRLSIDSRTGAGTTMRVELPLAVAALSQAV